MPATENPRVSIGRRYRFSASHRLHTPLLSDEENRSVYGKCNNPYGHGHNFTLEVVYSGIIGQPAGRVLPLAALDAFISEVVLRDFDNVDLNTQIEEFAGVPPTSENLARVLSRRLYSAWPLWFPHQGAKLEKVRIWETARNIFEQSTGPDVRQHAAVPLARAEIKP